MIKESGELALSWVKNYAYDLCITNGRSEDPLKVPEPIDIHLHLPAGATKKDGPSAGVAMVCLLPRLSSALFWVVQDSDPGSIQTCAFVSLLTGACVPTNIAMTGEVRAFAEFINSGTTAHLFLLLDHAERPGNPRRWYQGEGARRAPCAGDEGHSAVG